MKVRYITIEEVEFAAHELARKHMTWNEPIPDFGTRFPTVLERCLAAPQQKFSRRHLYKGLIGRAAILFYLLIKNHPFQNGNKRIAVMTTLYFFYKNGKWLKVSNQSLYNFAKWIAASDAQLKDSVMLAIEEYFKKSLVDSHQ